jgi:hypothetical protein
MWAFSNLIYYFVGRTHVASSSASDHWCSGLLEGLSVLVLPETLGHKLLNTVLVDADMLGRNKHQIRNKLKKNIGTLQFLCFEN